MAQAPEARADPFSRATPHFSGDRHWGRVPHCLSNSGAECTPQCINATAGRSPTASAKICNGGPGQLVLLVPQVCEAWVTVLSTLRRKGGLTSSELWLDGHTSALEGRLEPHSVVEISAPSVAQAEAASVPPRRTRWQRTIQRCAAGRQRQGQGQGLEQDQRDPCHRTSCRGITGTACCSCTGSTLDRWVELRCPTRDTDQARCADLCSQDGGTASARGGCHFGRAGQCSHAGPRESNSSRCVPEGQRCTGAQQSPQLSQGLFIIMGQLPAPTLHYSGAAVRRAEDHAGSFRQPGTEMERAAGHCLGQSCSLDGQRPEDRFGFRSGAGCQNGCRQRRGQLGSFERSLELCRAGCQARAGAVAARAGLAKSPRGCRPDCSCSATRCFTHAQAQGQGRGRQGRRGGPWQGPDLSLMIREGPCGLLQSWQHRVTTMHDFVSAFYARTRAIMFEADVHWELHGTQPRPLLPDPRIDDEQIDNELMVHDTESLQASLYAYKDETLRWPGLSVSCDPGRPDTIVGAWPHGQYGPVEPPWISGPPADELVRAGEDLHYRCEGAVHNSRLCTFGCFKGLASKHKVPRSVRFGFAVSFWFPNRHQLCLPSRTSHSDSGGGATSCGPALAALPFPTQAVPALPIQPLCIRSLEGYFPRLSPSPHALTRQYHKPCSSSEHSANDVRGDRCPASALTAAMPLQGGSCRPLVAYPAHVRPPTPPIPSGRWDRNFGRSRAGSICDLDSSEDIHRAAPASGGGVTVQSGTDLPFDDTTFAVFDVIFHARVLRCRSDDSHSTLAAIAFEQSPLIGHPRNFRVVQHNLPGFPNRQLVIWGRKEENHVTPTFYRFSWDPWRVRFAPSKCRVMQLPCKLLRWPAGTALLRALCWLARPLVLYNYMSMASVSCPLFRQSARQLILPRYCRALRSPLFLAPLQQCPHISVPGGGASLSCSNAPALHRMLLCRCQFRSLR